MSRPLTEDDLRDAPQAHNVTVTLCANPLCLRPHIVLHNEDGSVIAHFVVPDRRVDGGSFMADVQEVVEQSDRLQQAHNHGRRFS